MKSEIDLSQYESRTTLKQTPNVSWMDKIKANIAYRQFLKNFQYVKGSKKQDRKYFFQIILYVPASPRFQPAILKIIQ